MGPLQAGTVVKFERTQEGWKRVKKTLESETWDEEPAKDATDTKKPSPQAPARTANLSKASTSKISDTGAKKPAATRNQTVASATASKAPTSGLLALARRRSSTSVDMEVEEESEEEVEQEEEDQWDEQDEWDEEWQDEEWPGSAPEPSAKRSRLEGGESVKKGNTVPNINMDQSYSGVVTKRDAKSGDLLISCEPVAQAFGRPAAISESENRMGARIGSIVVFKVQAGKSGKPMAMNIIINGFEQVDGAEELELPELPEPEPPRGGKGRKAPCGKGSKSTSAATWAQSTSMKGSRGVSGAPWAQSSLSKGNRTSSGAPWAQGKSSKGKGLAASSHGKLGKGAKSFGKSRSYG